MIDVVIGGLTVRLAGDARAAREALALRFHAFAHDAGAARPDVTLTIDAAPGFSTGFHLERGNAALRVAASAGGRLRLEGAARGWYDVQGRTGALEGATHLGEVDALLRLALSLELPRRGALLLHGAAVEEHGGRVALLVGASGSGKSTAAAALGAGLGDELIVLHPAEAPPLASGTPYWFGAPARREVARLVCLDRAAAGGVGSRQALGGGAALRALAPHVVRYVVDGESDRAVFALLGAAAARVAVERLACPEGAAYIPFLRAALAPEAHP